MTEDVGKLDRIEDRIAFLEREMLNSEHILSVHMRDYLHAHVELFREENKELYRFGDYNNAQRRYLDMIMNRFFEEKYK